MDTGALKWRNIRCRTKSYLFFREEFFSSREFLKLGCFREVLLEKKRSEDEKKVFDNEIFENNLLENKTDLMVSKSFETSREFFNRFKNVCSSHRRLQSFACRISMLDIAIQIADNLIVGSGRGHTTRSRRGIYRPPAYSQA